MEPTNILCLLGGIALGIGLTLGVIGAILVWGAKGSPDVNGAPEADAGLPLQPATDH